MGNSINTNKYIGIGYRGIVAPSIDSSAAAFFSATGITGATQQSAVDALVKGLKADGLWSKMKAVYPFVTDNRNLLSYTEDFSNAYWVKDKNGTGITPVVTVNSIVAPDGTTTASRIQLDRGTGTASSDFSLIYNTSNITLSAAGVYSFYAKSQTGSNQTLLVYWGGGQGTTFTLTTTWQRFEINNLSAASNAIVFGTRAGSGAYYNGGQQVLDIAVWHPQLELGSTATTYQPIATTQQAYISSQFKYNLVNPVDSDAAFRLVFNGGWTHSSTGATPNGTNGYADTKFNPNTQLSFTNAHVSLYKNLGTISAIEKVNGVYDIGANTVEFGIHPDRNTTLYSQIGLGSYVIDSSVGGNSSVQGNGYYIGARNANNFIRLNKNNTNTLTNTTTSSPAAFPNDFVWLGGSHQVAQNTLISPNNYRYAMFTMGEYLNATEALNLYTRVQAFQTALSRQV